MFAGRALVPHCKYRVDSKLLYQGFLWPSWDAQQVRIASRVSVTTALAFNLLPRQSTLWLPCTSRGTILLRPIDRNIGCMGAKQAGSLKA